MIHLSLLGSVQVSQEQSSPDRGGHSRPTLRFRSRRTVALLGYLAAERRPISRDYLATLFWPDDEPSTGRANLRRELYNLTRLLPDCWKTDAQTISFAPTDDAAVDIDIILQLQGEGRWEEAAALLTGDFLEGISLPNNDRFENWLLAEREKWQERSQGILRRVCDNLVGCGQLADALPYARHLVQTGPWNEDNHQQLMRLLAWTGHREQALKQFTACCQALADELGVEPASTTVALYEQIKAGELAAPPVPPAFLKVATGSRLEAEDLFVMRQRELAWLARQLDRALAGQGGVAFITGSPGQGKTALLDAFTRQALAAHPDLLVARGNCAAYGGVGDPYLPFRDIMTVLTGDIEAQWTAGTISTSHARRLWQGLPIVLSSILERGPDLIDIFLNGQAVLNLVRAAGPACRQLALCMEEHLQLQVAGAARSKESYLFEQFSNVLQDISTSRPLLLFLDDLQWIDTASVGLLFHLVRRMSATPSRILIIGAYRPDELIREQRRERYPLASVLSEFKCMFGEIWLSLSWADEEEGWQFVNAVLDSEPNNLDLAFRKNLFQRTGGHPLFTLELLRAMRDRAYLVRGVDGCWQVGPQIDWQMMPARVEAIIAERINQLRPDLREVLTVASVEGELFTAQVVARVMDRQEGSILRRLTRELYVEHRLVRELETYQAGGQAIVRYSFRHVLFQQYVYFQLSTVERQLLHRMVGTAIESVYSHSLEERTVQLARHFDRAGDYERALSYYTCAALKAASVYAYDEALDYYRRAIELAQTAGTPLREMADLYYGRGLANETRGQFDLALADFECALDLSQAATAPRLEWHILLELGRLWSSRDYDRARDFLQQALELARELNDPAILGNSLNQMGNWLANNENPAGALRYHQEALQIFEALEDRINLASTLDFLGIAHLLTGDTSVSVAGHYSRAIHLFRELGNYPRLISSLIARALMAAGPAMLAPTPAELPRDPFEDLGEALQIARRIGSSPDEAWCAWAKALLYTVGGDYARALEAGQQGLQLATSIKHHEWQAGNRYALGFVYNELLQPEQALPELMSALALAQDLHSQYWVNHVSAALASAYMLLGDLARAKECLEGVIGPETAMDTAGKRICWARRAQLALAMGDPPQALDICDRLLATAAGLTANGIITSLWLLRAETLLAMGRVSESRELLATGCEEADRRKERFLLWRFHEAQERADAMWEVMSG